MWVVGLSPFIFKTVARVFNSLLFSLISVCITAKGKENHFQKQDTFLQHFCLTVNCGFLFFQDGVIGKLPDIIKSY